MGFRMFLFDVDGTLVNTQGAGRRALVQAFAELWGVLDAFSGYGFSGRTDRRIVKDAFRRHFQREPSQAEEETSLERYVQLLDRYLSDPPQPVLVLPGIRPLLDRLSQLSLPLGLATGNLQRGAYLKLAAAGLDGYFPFGGFGSDSEDRTELTRIAADRGRAYAMDHHPNGGRIENNEVLVIGDSPLDIQAAHGAGLPVLAVVSGWSTREELTGASPDYLLNDLSDTEAVMNLLRGSG